MTKQEKLTQRKLEAKVQAQRNAEKSKSVIVAGNLQSQWGKVVTNEQRLIDNGHFMKTGERAKLDYLRESYRKAKKAKNDNVKIILVKKV